jgi:hypothetical protein
MRLVTIQKLVLVSTLALTSNANALLINFDSVDNTLSDTSIPNGYSFSK